MSLSVNTGKLDTLKSNVHVRTIKISVPISQETRYLSITNMAHLMLLREVIAD
jgi:hypothetical protein